LGAGKATRGVVEPDMQLRLELVDPHGAAPDDIAAVIDQDPQLAHALDDAVPVQTGVGVAA
jgi:hypothetical protein